MLKVRYIFKAIHACALSGALLIAGCASSPSENVTSRGGKGEITCGTQLDLFRNQEIDLTKACKYENGSKANPEFLSAKTDTVDITQNGTYPLTVTVTNENGDIAVYELEVTVREPQVTTPSVVQLCAKPDKPIPTATPTPTPEPTPEETKEPEPTPTAVPTAAPTPSAAPTYVPEPAPVYTPEPEVIEVYTEEVKEKIANCERASGIWDGQECIYPILE